MIAPEVLTNLAYPNPQLQLASVSRAGTRPLGEVLL